MMQIIEQNIPLETYLQLRRDSGLSTKSIEAATIALAHTLYAVVVKNDQEAYIGMGRVIGDGGCFCQVVDICVLPQHQGKGIGKKIMEKIKSYVDEKLPATCYVSLLADGQTDKLYAQFGFQETMPQSKGMYIKK
jgi:GNAT superfamily N-acetyltransferase